MVIDLVFVKYASLLNDEKLIYSVCEAKTIRILCIILIGIRRESHMKMNFPFIFHIDLVLNFALDPHFFLLNKSNINCSVQGKYTFTMVTFYL